jgi:hypothetical protein
VRGRDDVALRDHSPTTEVVTRGGVVEAGGPDPLGYDEHLEKEWTNILVYRRELGIGIKVLLCTVLYS